MKIDYLKQVATNILNQEIKENNIDVNYKVLSGNEFDKYRKKFNIKRSDNNSFYDEECNTIFIVIGNDVNLDDRDFFDLIFECFHEIRHAVQKNFIKNSYEGFFYFIDDINSYNSFDYNNISHDGYFFEIDAEIYSVNKIRGYLKEKFPEKYKNFIEEINLIEEIRNLEYLLYNTTSRFNIFMSKFKYNLRIGRIKWKKEEDDDIVIPSLFNVFLNCDGSFKTISEIINNEKFNDIDNRIVYAVVSSKMFLDTVDYSNLSSFELSFLEGVLNYSNGLNNKQIILKKELFNKRRKLYIYRMNNEDSLFGKLYLTDRLNLDILLYNIRFNDFYKKDSNFFRNIALKKINNLIIKNDQMAKK